MLAGCPVVGIERGSPLLIDGSTGIRIADWTLESFVEGIERALCLDRQDVRRAALRVFDEELIASKVIGYLDRVRKRVVGAEDSGAIGGGGQKAPEK
jgi:hypothetical protein